MRRKRLLLLAEAGVSVLLVVGSALFVLLRPQQPSVPDLRIHPGMPLADVEAVFGKPADMEAPAPIGKRTLVWLDPTGPVPVEFDADDRVSPRGVRRPPPPTWLDDWKVRFRRRLGW
jgi:hypothetical protein